MTDRSQTALRGSGYLRAAVKEASKRSRDGAKAARVGAETAIERARESEDVRLSRIAGAAEKSAAKVRSSAKRAKVAPGRTRARHDALSGRAGATAVGAGVGRVTRRAGGELQRIPVLSLPSEVLRQKNGVVHLTERIEQEPANPFAYLWLAEALDSFQRDMSRYLVARTALSPSSLLTYHAIKSAASLGTDSELSQTETLLRRAYGLATSRLNAGGFDAEALHVIARVYLAKSNPDVAIKPAKLAVSGKDCPDRGAVLFTLARAFLAVRDHRAARNAAQTAAEEGCTLGYLVLADLLIEESDGASIGARHKEFVELCGRVSRKQRVDYYGTHRTQREILAGVWAGQLDKTRDGTTRVKARWSIARRAVTRKIEAGWLNSLPSSPESSA
jgi:hypothetical protein